VDGVCRPFSQKIQSRLPGRLDASTPAFLS